jgi:hypothetical protein
MYGVVRDSMFTAVGLIQGQLYHKATKRTVRHQQAGRSPAGGAAGKMVLHTKPMQSKRQGVGKPFL